MYPSIYGENLLHFDLSHMLPPSDKPGSYTRKRATLTATDRFNKRYGFK